MRAKLKNDIHDENMRKCYEYIDSVIMKYFPEHFSETIDIDYEEVKDEPVYGPPAFLKFLPPPNNVE